MKVHEFGLLSFSSLAPHRRYLAIAYVLCFLSLYWVRIMFDAQQMQSLNVQLAIDGVRAQFTSDIFAKAKIQSKGNSANPMQWPLRAEVDNVVHQVGEAAKFHGISLRALSTSHQASSAQAWGRVLLDVSASGSYIALKAWQASMQQRFPALSVHSLRLQANSLNQGGLDAQVLWVLHVRD